MVSLRMLGGLSVEGSEGPLSGPATQRKRLALLALLALAPERRLPREKILAYLWPESDSERARHQLSSALYEVRRVAGEDAVLATGDELRLNSDVVRADVFEFEDALQEDDPGRAAALYQGPFLDGFFLSGSHEFEDWVERERARLRSGFARALEALAEVAEQQGDRADTVERWKARAALDPYDSRVALRLMRALEAAGNRAGAIQHAQVHEALLREEFDAEPEPEVRAFAERLRTSPARAGTPGAGQGAAAQKIVAESVPESVAGLSEGRAPPTTRPRPGTSEPTGHGSGPIRRWVGPLGLLGLAGLAMVIAAAWLDRQTSSLPHDERIVVAPFENRTGDPDLDPVGGMTADWIARALSRAAYANVVFAPEPAPRSEGPEPVAAGGPGSVSGTGIGFRGGIVVSGAFYRSGDSLQFHPRITAASDGRLLRSLAPINGHAADPGPVVEDLGRRAAATVAVVLDTRLATLGNLASPPSNYEAFFACLEGMAAFLALDWPTATRHFERSMELDPDYPFPLLHIGYIHLNEGHRVGADSVARIMEGHRERMRPFELAVLDLLAAYVAEDPVAAYEAASRAAAIGPGSPPNVQLGREALRLNRPREAIRILSEIDPQAAPLGGWPVYWESLTGARHALGHHRRELREARRVRELHPDEPWSLLLEARARAARGHLLRLDGIIDARRSQPDRRHPRLGPMKEAIGHELRVHGRTESAREMFERAIAWYDARPARERADADHRRGLGLALFAAGRADEAEPFFRGLVQEAPDDVASTGVLGVLAAERGDQAGALAIAHDLAGIRRSHGTGDQLLWQGCITARLGDLPAALSLLQEAAGRGSRFDHSHFCLDPLREYHPFREFIRPRG